MHYQADFWAETRHMQRLALKTWLSIAAPSSSSLLCRLFFAWTKYHGQFFPWGDGGGAGGRGVETNEPCERCQNQRQPTRISSDYGNQWPGTDLRILRAALRGSLPGIQLSRALANPQTLLPHPLQNHFFILLKNEFSKQLILNHKELDKEATLVQLKDFKKLFNK